MSFFCTCDIPPKAKKRNCNPVMGPIIRMNMSDHARYRTLIDTRLAELAQEDALGQDAQAVVTLDQQAVGRLSRMDALQAQAMAKAQQARRAQMSRLLHAALHRLDNGEFGYCDDCGEGIGEKRLSLNPTVTRCISCASG
jgi:DnaK suppressor protein